MHIGIYSPYIDTLGGGERYVLTVASHWAKTHTVDLFWDGEDIADAIETRLGISMRQIHVRKNIFKNTAFLEKCIQTVRYDVLFFLSDGSIPFSLSKRTIVHFQAPFQKVPCSLLKRKRIHAVVCNSKYTRENLDMNFSDASVVIYPPVDVHSFTPEKKEKIILSVGRFSSSYQAKKQDILIRSFITLQKSHPMQKYVMILAGGLLSQDTEYFRSLQQMADGYPIEFKPNCSFAELRSLYGRARFYWHAAGFNEKNPMHMEHFGISTVESMAAGCIPVVFAGGGQSEIVEHGVNGYLWHTTGDLVRFTETLAQQDSACVDIAQKAIARSDAFSKQRFFESFDALLQSLL